MSTAGLWSVELLGLRNSSSLARARSTVDPCTVDLHLYLYLAPGCGCGVSG